MAEEKEPGEKTERITAAELAVAVVRVTSVLIPKTSGDVREALLELQQLALDYLEQHARVRRWRGGGGRRRNPRY